MITDPMQQSILYKTCWLLIIVSILYGLHLRVTAINKTEIDGPIRADAYQYYHYAKNIAESGVYSQQVSNDGVLKPDALRSPGFPVFASIFFSSDVDKTLNNTLWAQTIIQIFCFGLVSIAMLSLLGLWWSLPTIFLLWTFPHFVSINTYYLSESLFTSFLALMLYFAWYFSNKNKHHFKGIIVCGLLLGFTALIRPIVEYFPIYLIVVSLLLAPHLSKKAILFAIIAFVPIIFWKTRNMLVLEMWSDPALMINALYHGSFPDMMYNYDRSTIGAAYKFDPEQYKVSGGVDSTITLIWQKFIQSPKEYLNWYLIGKQKFLWQWSVLTGQGDIFIYKIVKSPYLYLPDMKATHALHNMIHNIWVVTGLITSFVIVLLNLIKKIKIPFVWVLMALLIIYVVLIHIIIAPYPRYGIPFKLYLIPLFIFGIQSVVTMSRELWMKNQKL
jgi:hypothetical protein